MITVTLVAVISACVPAPPPAPAPKAVPPTTAPKPPAPTTTQPSAPTTTQPPTPPTTVPPPLLSCGTGTGAAAQSSGAIVLPSTVGEGAVAVKAAANIASLKARGGAVVVTSVDGYGNPSTRAVPAPEAAPYAAALDAKAGTRVLSVEPDVQVSLAAATSRAAGVSGPGDPARVQQWAFDNASFEDAWECSQGEGITIAVIDTGIDINHEEFVGRASGGPDFTTSTTGVPGGGGTDGHGHGTHVAGTVAAAHNNGVGLAGVAPKAHIVGIKVIGANGLGSTSSVAEAINWAVTNGADVINLSLSSSAPFYGLEVAVLNAQANGVVVVAAAGNYGHDAEPSWPAKYPSVIAVSAYELSPITGKRTIASYSSRGDYVDVAAPGTNIYSTTPGNTYRSMNGTSMATPHVAGLAAAMIGAGIDPSQVKGLLEATADDAGAPGFDDRFGHGVVNPRQAIR